jgi:RES domain-containing protein
MKEKPIFKSWRDYWNFERSVKENARYFHNRDTQEFFKAVSATGEARKRRLKKESILWRAQIGHDWQPLNDLDGAYIDDQPCPLSPARMKPIPRKASEGRANPKGIPYLYLSTDDETAMSEVRPWVGSLISVGQFKITKDLVLIDSSANNDKSFVYYLSEPVPEKRELAVWAHIDQAFSKPMTNNDQVAEYVPTQVIAELFRHEGMDGILYRSSLGKGSNIVLFDLEVAELINCFVHEATALSFSFKQVANPYFVVKKTDEENRLEPKEPT